MEYKTPQYPCFVCRVEDSLGQERGSQSHPINCGWRLQRESELREEALDKIIKLTCFSKDDNLEDVLRDIRLIAQTAVVASTYRLKEEE